MGLLYLISWNKILRYFIFFSQQHMVKVKQWWDDEGWFGKQDSKLRKQLREACSELLESLGFKCQCPVLLMTLELMFSTKAGFGKVSSVIYMPLD